MRKLGLTSTTRASFYLYNTEERSTASSSPSSEYRSFSRGEMA